MSQSDTSSTSSVPTVQTDFEVLDAEHDGGSRRPAYVPDRGTGLAVDPRPQGA